jgi:hypothetical protein
LLESWSRSGARAQSEANTAIRASIRISRVPKTQNTKIARIAPINAWERHLISEKSSERIKSYLDAGLGVELEIASEIS